MPIQPVKPEQMMHLKALFYGPNGRGKTTLLGTAQEDPRTSPMAFIDWEGNVESLYGLDIDIFKVRSHNDFADVYAMLSKSNHGYKSIGIDSLTEISTAFLMFEMQRRNKLGGPGREEYPDQAQQQDYGAILVQQRRLLRRFRDLPMHVFYTALDYLEAEPGEGMVKKPSMQGAMRNEAGGLMSVVGYLAIDKEKKDAKGEPIRVLQLRDIPQTRVKARTPWGKVDSVPRMLENPTISRVMDLYFPTLSVVKEQTA